MNCQIDGASLQIMKQEQQKDEALRKVLIIATLQKRLQKAKDLIKQYAKPRGSVVDALIAERRKAAHNE